MRYVFIAVLGTVSLLLCGSFFGIATIAGLVPDLILLIGLSLALNEKSIVPLLFVIIFGLLFDDLFSPVLGGNAFSYAVSIGFVMLVTRKADTLRIWSPALIGFFAYVIKEIILAIIVFALGNRFDFLYMLCRFILPGALLTAGIMIPMYYLFHWLYTFPWMKQHRVFRDEYDL